MTDEDQAKILSVTSKLTGEFYVGQRVRITNPHIEAFGELGTVVHLMPRWVDVRLDTDLVGRRSFLPTSIEAAV